MTKIEPRAARVSPDDVKYKLDQLARLSATDTRTPGEIYLGDPPPHRSALAQRKPRATGVIEPLIVMGRRVPIR
jgi:hypothetical protein